MEMAEAHLLDFSKEFDVTLLDQFVMVAFDPSNPNRNAANEFLVRMKEHPEMWKRADAILETSKQVTTRFFGLQVLQEAISTRWKILPQEQREGIRNYIVTKIIGMASVDRSNRDGESNRFLDRLNLVLVQVLKQDWPHAWPTFIGDIVESSKTSESLCENNMQILKLLSEEVFDFSRESMTAAKSKSMGQNLHKEFGQIFELCQLVLETSQNQALLVSTLKTLQRFLSWIHPDYIFETKMLDLIVTRFLCVPIFRTPALDCLVEVANLSRGDIPAKHNYRIWGIFQGAISTISNDLPPHINLADIYNTGNEDACLFLARLALFLGSFLGNHLHLLEGSAFANAEAGAVLTTALQLLVRLSQCDDEDIFKTCLEFWHLFSKDLHSSMTVSASRAAAGVTPGGRHRAYEEMVLPQVREVCIDKMAKPEEVIVVVDENGEVVRERAKDTDVIAQYKSMKETIVYLTHLNYEATEQLMLQKLDAQVEGGRFAWGALNTLCWAIGSISMAMHEIDEKRFLVTVIKDLLKLCEEQKGKENKAVVASNIMYIVGQYPRFLRAHWKFLKTVVNKLFEFMHEYHPGVQDMACDTFLKIAQKCKRKFMTPQDGPDPFVVTLIKDISLHIKDLEPHQVQSFYESVACMLSDSSPAISIPRDQVMMMLTEVLNSQWQNIMAEGAKDVNELLILEVVKELSKILKCNIRICRAAGSIYIHQLSSIFLDALNLYHLYSEQIKHACATQGEIATRYTLFKNLRLVKADILELTTAFLENIQGLDGGPQAIMQSIMPPLMREVLIDYKTSPPQARDAKVLVLFATAIGALREHMAEQVPTIMEHIFEPSLELITTNMTDNPDHRLGFFKFLREANEHTFFGLFSIPPASQKMVVDSIVWAFKHTERNISETGLEILQELLVKLASNRNIAQAFYQQFLLQLIQDVMGILTDRSHKSGFALQAAALRHMFHLVEGGQVDAPLFDPASSPFTTNAEFLHDYIAKLITTAFPNLSKQQVGAFVAGVFSQNMSLELFREHLRDFLIQIKEFSEDDNSELFLEEREAQQAAAHKAILEYQQSVPGLLKPSDLADDPDL